MLFCDLLGFAVDFIVCLVYVGWDSHGLLIWCLCFGFCLPRYLVVDVGVWLLCRALGFRMLRWFRWFLVVSAFVFCTYVILLGLSVCLCLLVCSLHVVTLVGFGLLELIFDGL